MTESSKVQEFIYRYSVLAYFLYAIRDALTGSIRFYFDMFGLGILWFVPDMMAFGAVFLFIYLQFYVKKNIIGQFFVVLFLFSAASSVVFMNTTIFALFSSLKMFIPMFIGMCFMDRSITESPRQRRYLFIIMMVSAWGIILNPYVEYPWVGQSFSSFGIERDASKLWWAEGAIRYGGFAGDSTMAAYMVVFLYFLLSPYYSIKANLALWPILIAAVHISTSKTAIGVLYIYFAAYLVFFAGRKYSVLIRNVRLLTQLSFLCLAIPLVLIVIFSGVNLADLDPKLMSLSVRIDESWQAPFKYLSEHYVPGLFLGCGIGCFSYPMDYTALADGNVTVDNFYLTTLLMMGMPFAIFVLFIFRSVGLTSSPTKLISLMIFNVYSITVQCYGPSFATLMFGYAVSEMFSWTYKQRRLGLSPRSLAGGDFGAAGEPAAAMQR